MSRARKAAASGKIIADAINAADVAIRQATEREQEWLAAGIDSWSAELTRYFDELSQHAHRTFADLQKCETAFDVLKVEQEWWAARSKAYLESGLRFAQTFSEAAARLGAPERRFDAL